VSEDVTDAAMRLQPVVMPLTSDAWCPWIVMQPRGLTASGSRLVPQYSDETQ
jgi:hypothetical protein